MPAIATVTSGDVAEAATTLLEQGKQVSGGSLRAVLGRGRPDRLMALWKEQQPAADDQAAVPPPPVLPPALTDALAAASARMTGELANLFGAAWQAAEATAQARIAGEVEAARTSVDAITAERDEALVAVDGADAQIAELRAVLVAERNGRAEEFREHAGELEAVRTEARLAMAEAEATRAAMQALQDRMMVGLQEGMAEIMGKLTAQGSVEDVPVKRGRKRRSGTNAMLEVA